MGTRFLEYKNGDVACRGYLAEPDGAGRRPGVVVFHEAPGLADQPKRRAAMLAEELGVVALAADMYGGGAEPMTTPEGLARMERLLADRSALRRRALAAVEALRALPGVDPDRVAAIGYCFGGCTALELARAGTDLRGVVSFHGALKTSTPAEPGAIRARILMCNGAEDPLVPIEDRNAAEAEFTRGGADWQHIVYAGAKHAFTNQAAPPREGFGYQAAADRRSWRHMKDFFAEVLA